MSQTVTIQQEEVQALKACIAELRRKGRRRQFPESVRARILALRQAGWPVQRLASELGLAVSQIYTWAKRQQNPVPHVLHVEPPARSSEVTEPLPPARSPEMTEPLPPGALQLRWGAFCITVAVAGA